MEVLVVLCPSSLAHWLVDFRSGDSHFFLFFGFVFFSFLISSHCLLLPVINVM